MKVARLNVLNQRGSLALVIVTCAALLSACSGQSTSSAEQGNGSKVENAFRGVMQDRTSKSPNEALFVEKCAMCHRQMGMSTVILARRIDPKRAMLETHNDLTADFIKSAARQGIGNMPRISRGEVSDAQLVRITAYLGEK